MQQQQKVNKNFISVNKIRISIIYFFASILISLIFKTFSIYWIISIIAISLIFLYLYIFYFQIYYNSLKYTLTKDYIILYYGFIFSKKSLIKISSITKISITQSLLQRFFKIKTIYIFASGTSNHISSLTQKSIEEILKTSNYLIF